MPSYFTDPIKKLIKNHHFSRAYKWVKFIGESGQFPILPILHLWVNLNHNCIVQINYNKDCQKFTLSPPSNDQKRPQWRLVPKKP
jgi:hypothetical protein